MKYKLAVLLVTLMLVSCNSENDEIINTADPTIETGLLLGRNILVSGVPREYHIYVPEEYLNTPVVFLFHGHNNDYNGVIGLDNNGNEQTVSTFPYKTWLSIAERENIIIAVLNGFNSGTNKGWNDCRQDAEGNSNEDDVLFTSNLIDYIAETYQANSNRIYVTGTSNGGHMAIRLAQELSSKVTAFAAISASNPINSQCVESTDPISALFMCGTEDPLLPYNGGQIAEEEPNNRGFVYPVEQTVDYWVQRNQTNSSPKETEIPDSFTFDNSTVIKFEYAGGLNNTQVVFYKIIGGGHASPSPTQRYNYPYVPFALGEQNGDIEMAEEVWNFFKNKSK